MTRAPLVSLAAAACAGAAAWFSLGAIAVTDTSVASRVGLLPALWLLPVLVVSFVAAAWAARLSRAAALPLFFSLVLLLPWIPGPIPAAFLLWTGRMVYAVWLAIAAAYVVSGFSRTRGYVPASFLARQRRIAADAGSHSGEAIIAALIAFSLYAFAGWKLGAILPGGDEPHYLVIAQSLLRDGDLMIANNHARGDYREYFGGELPPDYLKRGTNGEIYSIHAPGLPAVVAPAFALFGYPGVVMFLCAVAAWGSALLWRAAYSLTGDASAAWFAWAATALTVPIFFEAFAVFPDGFGATLVLFAAMPIIRAQGSRLTRAEGLGIRAEGLGIRAEGLGLIRAKGLGLRAEGRGWVARGAALALLPWLHTRFAVISGALGLILVLRLIVSREGRSRIAPFLALPVVSAIAWFAFFRVIYGTFDPAAPYGGATQSALGNILNGLPALFLDQQFGIIPNAPVYIFSLAGMLALARVNWRLAAELSTVAAVYLLSTSMFHMWWGGSSAPARFAVAVLPLLALPGAWWWHRAGDTASRAIALAALLWSVGTTLVFVWVDDGRLAYNFRDGYARALDWLTPVVDVSQGLPSFFRQTPAGAVMRAAIWGVVFVAALVGLRIVARRSARRSALALTTPACLAAAVMMALSAVWTIDGVAAPAPETSQLKLLESFDTRLRPLALRFASMSLEPASRALSDISIGTPVRRGDAPAGVLLLVPGILPGGRYELRRSSGTVLSGTAALVIGGNKAPLKTWNLAETFSDGSTELELPVTVGSLVISGERGHAPTVLTLHPQEIFEGRSRLTADYANRAQRYGQATMFFYDANAFIEGAGIWVRGGSVTQIAVASQERGTPLRLRLRNAPVANRVTIEIDGDRQVLEMTPGQEHELQISIAGDRPAALVRIGSSAGFRPSLLEPGSTDNRFLGVRIETH